MKSIQGVEAVRNIKAVGRVLCPGLVCAAVLGLASPRTQAQSLEEQYAFYLSAKCTNLQFDRIDGEVFDDLVPGQAGAELDAFCSGTPSVGGGSSSESASTGVGATSGAAADAALRRRQASLRSGKEGEAGGGDEFGILASGRTSLFGSFNYARDDQKARRFEGGRRVDQLALTLGVDWRLGTTGLLGIAAGIEDQSGDLDAGGTIDNRGYSAILYGSWLPAPAVFVDLSGGLVQRDIETSRTVSFTRTFNNGGGPVVVESIAPARAESKTDQQEWRGALLTGYDWQFGGSGLGPRLALEYRRSRIDGVVESGATPMTLRIDQQTEKSLRGGLGLQASRVMNTTSAVFVLQLNADWWHEFQDDQRFIEARFAQDLRPNPVRLRYQNQPPDRDVFTSRLSLGVTMPRGFSAFLSVDALFGHSYLEHYGAGLGLRKEL